MRKRRSRYFYQRFHQRPWKFRLLVCLGLILSLLLNLVMPMRVNAHSVAQVQTTKFFAPETVQLIKDRATSGTPGLQAGDIISYIIQFTPIPNGATIGPNGYLTDYIPPNSEVVGASFVKPNGSGGYTDVAPDLPGPIANGWGPQVSMPQTFSNWSTTDPTTLSLCSAAGKTLNNCNGSLAQVYADTGIFYSTDSRLAVSPTPNGPIQQGTNGYYINPTAASQLWDDVGNPSATVNTTHNLWDAQQTNAFGTTALTSNTPNANSSSSIINAATGRGSTPFNSGSAVAGTDSGYKLDNTGNVGPWKRIAYPNSRIGNPTGPGISDTGSYNDPIDSLTAVVGTYTNSGWNLSSSNPLPTSTKAVRWAVGRLVVGDIKSVKISLRLTAAPPSTGFINNSEIFGGDSAQAAGKAGNDSAWRYNIPSVATLNSNLYVFKQVVKVNGQPSNGAVIPASAKIRYRITYLNTGASAQTNVRLSDTLPSQTGAGSVSNLAIINGLNIVPISPASPTAGGTFNFQPITSLNSGSGGAVEFDVQTNAALGNVVTNKSKLVSNELATGVTSNAVSSVTNTATLQISKSVTPGSIQPGGVVTYTLTATNTGNAAASSIVVYDFLPTSGGANDANTRFNFVTGSSSFTGITAVTPIAIAPPDRVPYTSNNRQQVSWNFGSQTLAVGASFTISFQAQAGSAVPTSTTPYTNDARVVYNDGVVVIEANATATAPVTVVLPEYNLSGNVFEDVNYGGGDGRSLTTSSGVGRLNALVELYNTSGNFVTSTLTNPSGQYTFTDVTPSTYTVRVVNSSVTSSRTGGTTAGLIPVPTFRTNGLGAEVKDRVGGENPIKVDAVANTTNANLSTLNTATTQAQSITSVTLTNSDITGIDFGFNFDTVVNTNNTGQGSLAQFITNSNALGNTGLNQAGLTLGVETSIFMISDGNIHPGLRSGLTNQLTNGVAQIDLTSSLLAITDANTSIDGTTQTNNIGNTNSSILGAGGAGFRVGVGADGIANTGDEPILAKVNAPEIQIKGTSSINVGIDIQANNTTVRGISIYGFGAAANDNNHANIRIGDNKTGTLIEQNLLGATATSFTDPGAGARSTGDNIRSVGGDSGIVRNNLIGFSAGKGFGVENDSTNWLIQNNEIRGNAIGNSNLDGIDLENGGTTNNTVSANLIVDNEGVGVDSYISNGSNIIENNTISGNGIGAGGNVETPGVRLYGSNNQVRSNLINANYGAGVMVTSAASSNLISKNSIFANGTISGGIGGASNQIGIDLLASGNDESIGTSPYVTLNDDNDSDTGANGLLNFPVFTSAAISGSNLILTGYARPGAAIELFIADPDASSFGEGKTYLTTLVEGSTDDSDATTGSYSGVVNGVDSGTDNTNKFEFTIPKPSNVNNTSKLTATATISNATSEFSGVTPVIGGAPKLLLVKRITAINGVAVTGFEDWIDTSNSKALDDNNTYWPNPNTTYLRGAINKNNIPPGAEVEYTVYFLSAGDSDASNVTICDLVPQQMKFTRDSYGFDLGIAMDLNTASLADPDNPNLLLTNIFDNDRGAFYTPGTQPPAACKNPLEEPTPTTPLTVTDNKSGVVVVNVVKSPDRLPYATSSGNPPNSYGFIRFKAKVK